MKNKLSRNRKAFIIAFLAPTIIAFCIFYLYPIITVFLTSFCKWDYTNITSPEFFGWKEMWNNYDYILIFIHISGRLSGIRQHGHFLVW